MDVVALVPARDHVCTRYRVEQFEAHLNAVGLRLRLEPLAPRLTDRVRQLARPRRQDVVLLVRKLLPLWQLLLLRRSASRLIYDFDDAVFARDSFHRRPGYSMTRAVRFGATIALSDQVIAGNTFLADAARRHAPQEKIAVIPTCLDPTRYTTADHDERRPTRLVWIGSKSTIRMLEKARDLLDAVGREVPQVMLRVICDRFPRFRDLPVEAAPWSPATEMSHLNRSDIGISWLPDDQWSRGKCGLKVLQYMAAGLPVVASPVGVHREMVESGPGFLAASTHEWVARIGSLVRDHRLRRDMGLQGRQRLEEHFHADKWGPVLANRLAEAASSL